MKKRLRIYSTICACAAALSTCSMFSAPAAAASESTVRIMGDLNNDMIVDVADAQQTLQRYVRSMSHLADDDVNTQTEVADINMDGIISLEDAANILSYYCQTLVGGRPLWADYRTVSYEGGANYSPIPEIDPETGEPVLDADGNPVMRNRTFALRGLYIEVGCASGKAGETVTVPVYVAGLPQLAGFQLSVFHELPLTLLDITSKINEQEGWNSNHKPESNPHADDNQGIIVAAQACNISLEDGFVISEFTYQIPEDAQPGTHYSITVDQSWTKFVSSDCCLFTNENPNVEAGSYQYTTLSGTVTVK